LEPVCFVDASYGGLLIIGEPHSISGIFTMLGGTAIFVKTRIQRTTALSATESETIAGCDAGKYVKYFRIFFTEIHFPLTRATPVGDDNEGTISIAHHRKPSGRTRHMFIQHFATQEWVQLGIIEFFKIAGQANPSDAMSKIIYRIIFYRHFDRLQGYTGPPLRPP
jgi:hypothetical protein